jgi:hypothetical protein
VLDIHYQDDDVGAESARTPYRRPTIFCALLLHEDDDVGGVQT